MKTYDEYLKAYAYDRNSSLLTREQIIERIQKCDFEDDQVGKDILNGIVTWKTDRRIYVDPDTIRDIKKLSSILTEVTYINSHRKEIERIWESLIKSPGIRAAMASTILHMFMPNVFPIIDQRAYRVIYEDKEMPNKISYSEYIEYVNKVVDYQKEKCSRIDFKEMDKILFQIDKENGNHIKH